MCLSQEDIIKHLTQEEDTIYIDRNELCKLIQANRTHVVWCVLNVTNHNLKSRSESCKTGIPNRRLGNGVLARGGDKSSESLPQARVGRATVDYLLQTLYVQIEIKLKIFIYLYYSENNLNNSQNGTLVNVNDFVQSYTKYLTNLVKFKYKCRPKNTTKTKIKSKWKIKRQYYVMAIKR